MPVSLSSRVAWLVPALLIVEACASGDRPTAPRTRPEFAISDAVHEGGTSGFFFLPPMVAQPAFSGTFDADITTLNPAIAICDITNIPDNNCGGAGGTSAIIVFTTTSTPAITVDVTTPQYRVNWNTRVAGFVAGNTYRVHVTAGASGARRELGFADVLLTTTPGQAKFLQTGDIIVLPDGRTLAIHVRIETGIPGSLAVSAATPTVAAAGTDVITATVNDLHGALLAGATVGWSVTTTPATGVADATQPLTPTSGQTGAAGTTATTFKAGATSGTATVTATSAGLLATATVNSSSVAIVTVATGLYHACGLTASGRAYCWGYNGYGQLGDGTTSDRVLPTPVSGGLTFAALSTTYTTTCGVTPGGAAYCWGLNASGQVGDGTTDQRLVPALVTGGLTFAAVSANSEHTCGLTTSGAAYCWGLNHVGQLGDGTTDQRLVPTPVAGGLTFVAVTSSSYVTCGLTAAGVAYCWGHPAFVGDGGTNPNTSVPVPVTGGLTFALLSGSFHVYVCGVTTSGAAYCWGSNSNGRLGDGTTQDRSVPTPVAGGLTFRAVSAGFLHACGVTTSDAAYCWGWNQYGQMGDGTSGTDHLVPTPVGGGLTFARVSAGGGQSCGVTTSNAVYCWGYNGNGTLGDGTTTNRLVPTAVASP